MQKLTGFIIQACLMKSSLSKSLDALHVTSGGLPRVGPNDAWCSFVATAQLSQA
jgi:hypothetical protein